MTGGLRGLADHWLRRPELKGLEGTDFDSPQATELQREVFARKPVMQYLYQQYCRPMVDSARNAPAGARMLEVGGGAGLLKHYLPEVISSDLICASWLDLACSAYALPFADASLDRIFLLFVCHHLGRMEDFLDEAHRCLKPGGEMVIVDPAITRFSRFYYRYLHVDQLDLEAEQWGFSHVGRLSGSNVALPWMVFMRDRGRFLARYPGFRVKAVEFNTCLSFLLSGGLRLRQMAPTALIRGLFNLERWLIAKAVPEMAVTMALTVARR